MISLPGASLGIYAGASNRCVCARRRNALRRRRRSRSRRRRRRRRARTRKRREEKRTSQEVGLRNRGNPSAHMCSDRPGRTKTLPTCMRTGPRRAPPGPPDISPILPDSYRPGHRSRQHLHFPLYTLRVEFLFLLLLDLSTFVHFPSPEPLRLSRLLLYPFHTVCLVADLRCFIRAPWKSPTQVPSTQFPPTIFHRLRI